MTEKQKAMELAAKLLKIEMSDAEAYCYALTDIEAWYFSVPVKGGASIIVGSDRTVLYANSSVGFEQHVGAFKNGTRTPIELFE